MQEVTVAEYVGMLDTLQKYIGEARRLRGEHVYRETETFLPEIRWNAQFSAKFRENTHDALREVLDIVYVETCAE